MEIRLVFLTRTDGSVFYTQTCLGFYHPALRLPVSTRNLGYGVDVLQVASQLQAARHTSGFPSPTTTALLCQATLHLGCFVLL